MNLFYCTKFRYTAQMQFFHSGYPEPTWSSEELRRRVETIMRLLHGETRTTMWTSITELAGETHYSDGRVKWPYAAYNVLSKKTLSSRERLIWSGFCYHNAVPFGLMFAYPYLCGVLSDESARFDLMNSWSNHKKPLMDSMLNLMTYDRYVSYLSTRAK